MPLRLTADDDLIEIALSTPGEWVKVKRALGRDEERERQKAILGAARVGPGGVLLGMDAGAALDYATFSTLDLAIKAWNFRDANNQPIPVTPRAIRALEDDDLAIITARLDELYPKERTEAEKKISASSGATTPSASPAPPMTSDGSR